MEIPHRLPPKDIFPLNTNPDREPAPSSQPPTPLSEPSPVEPSSTQSQTPVTPPRNSRRQTGQLALVGGGVIIGLLLACINPRVITLFTHSSSSPPTLTRELEENIFSLASTAQRRVDKQYLSENPNDMSSRHSETLNRYAKPAVVVIHNGNSKGTGFITSSDGYIVTNNHVLGAPNRGPVTITFADGSKINNAQIVGRSPEVDFALLKVNMNNALPYLEISDSEGAVGSKVATMGHGILDWTFTEGTLTANKIRISNMPTMQGQYNQADTRIMPGNSGGPLLTRRGEVTGLVTVTQHSQNNICYALDAPTIKTSVEKFKR